MLAEEAKELGLVDRVCEPDALLDEAMAMADELAANPPTQLRLIKQLLTQNAGETDLAAVQRREVEALDIADQDARARRGRRRLPRAADARLPLSYGQACTRLAVGRPVQDRRRGRPPRTPARRSGTGR